MFLSFLKRKYESKYFWFTPEFKIKIFTIKKTKTKIKFHWKCCARDRSIHCPWFPHDFRLVFCFPFCFLGRAFYTHIQYTYKKQVLLCALNDFRFKNFNSLRLPLPLLPLLLLLCLLFLENENVLLPDSNCVHSTQLLHISNHTCLKSMLLLYRLQRIVVSGLRFKYTFNENENEIARVSFW